MFWVSGLKVAEFAWIGLEDVLRNSGCPQDYIPNSYVGTTYLEDVLRNSGCPQ